MKKVLCLLMCAVLTAAVLCACSKTEEFTPDYSAAIGAIFVNDQQELPENTKVYADFSDNTYSFDLDAACVYYRTSPLSDLLADGKAGTVRQRHIQKEQGKAVWFAQAL